ncbi:MAG: alpha/beta hydrolase-fold protein [Bryobacteraceae bacterium]
MFLVAAIATLSCLCSAQTPPAGGLVSPEVHPDRTVTFRVRAPKATEVTVYGDWMPVGHPQPMTKREDGVWTIQTTPLEANGHLYWFNLDGVAVPDPINPVVKLRQRSSASLVEVPSSPPAAWELTDVPHGSVSTLWQKSTILDRTERMIVYLPPGYEQASARYPVLYLVHGSGDVPESWVNAGHANFILDNLIAQNKVKPMLIVMPAGHARLYDAPRGESPNNNEKFEQYLVKEVIPLVESTFRTASGPRNRALAGLSMGGGHSIYTGFHHPDLFGALGIFSPGLSAEPDPKLTDPKSLKLIWISCGDQDNTVRYEKIKAWAESVKPEGVDTSFHTYPGAHTWPVWRMSLTDFVPLLFTH